MIDDIPPAAATPTPPTEADPATASAPAPARIARPNPPINDLDTFALTIWGEARGEPIEGKIAVAMVVINRWKRSWQGDTTIAKICLHPSQFSCWIDEVEAMDGAMLALTAMRPDPNLVLCREIARAAMAGVIGDNTYGATAYLALGSLKTIPGWARSLTPTRVIGRQTFYAIAA